MKRRGLFMRIGPGAATEPGGIGSLFFIISAFMDLDGADKEERKNGDVEGDCED